ncbi:hypothetical protein PGQ11_013305 [Apiospora arundinis]|uniref:Uncharacterized protein n=1 Tax=Apiospora arundinis TaxID=335852 RepID=A0ABR2HNS5_9PEZI
MLGSTWLRKRPAGDASGLVRCGRPEIPCIRPARKTLDPGFDCPILSGIGHKCEDCYFQFNLCYKCYDLRDILHDPGHHFCELGPEFIEVSDGEAPNSPQQESPAEDSDSESDSDSSSSSSSSDSKQAPEQTSNVLASL